MELFDNDVVDDLPTTPEEVKYEWKPDVLVLGPGDYRCLLQYGLCMYLIKRNYLDRVTKYAACDNGALLALLLNMDIPLSEIGNILVRFEPLNPDFNLSNFINYHGLLDGQHISKYISSIVQKKYGKILSLKQLFETTGKELTVVSYLINEHNTIYINHESFPNMSCVTAVLLSYMRPLMFSKIKYKDQLYTGGLIGDPYPIKYYDDGILNIVGIYARQAHGNGDNPMNYITTIIEAPINSVYKLMIDITGDNCKNIEIISNNVDILGVSITKNEKFKIINNGWMTGKNFYNVSNDDNDQSCQETEEEFI